jgi:hypothetical protein
VHIAGFPPVAAGLIRDLRVRWALEEAGQAYDVRLPDAQAPRPAGYRCLQPFGQVPSYEEEGVSMFESDLVGSDGFHPMSRPQCTRLLRGAEIAVARMNLVTHNVSYNSAPILPGCYRVKAVVSLDATR